MPAQRAECAGEGWLGAWTYARNGVPAEVGWEQPHPLSRVLENARLAIQPQNDSCGQSVGITVACV